MAAGEAERLHLYEVARDRWGDDEAARTLMDFLPSGSDEFATKRDIEGLRNATKRDIEGLRNATKRDIEGLRNATKRDIEGLRHATQSDSQGIRSEISEVRSEIQVLDQSVDARIAGLRADLLQRMNEQTRTVVLANISMWLSIVALLIGLRFS